MELADQHWMNNMATKQMINIIEMLRNYRIKISELDCTIATISRDKNYIIKILLFILFVTYLVIFIYLIIPTVK
jgi:hypothetical protein